MNTIRWIVISTVGVLGWLLWTGFDVMDLQKGSPLGTTYLYGHQQGLTIYDENSHRPAECFRGDERWLARVQPGGFGCFIEDATSYRKGGQL